MLSMFRIISTIVYRDICLFFRYKTWFLGTFVFPLISPFAILFLARSLAGPHGEGLAHFKEVAQTSDYTSFIVIGTITWEFIGYILYGGGLALQRERRMGLLEVHWSMPVSRYAFLMGITVSSLVLSLVPMVFSFLMYWLFGAITIHGNLFAALFVALISLPQFMGMMLLFAVITLYLREAGELVSIIQTVLTVVCGIQVPLASLPGPLQAFGNWFPLTQFMVIFRGIVSQGQTLSDLAPKVIYLFCSSAAIFIAGLLLFIHFERKLRRRGALSGF